MKKNLNRIHIKKQKGRIKSLLNICDNNQNLFDNRIFYIKALEAGRITEKQLENIRRLLKRKLKFKRKRIKLLIKSKYKLLIKCNYPISKKPSEIRMGKGKGSVSKYVARVSAGQSLIKIQTLLEKQYLNNICKIIASKFNINIIFI